MKAFGRLQLVKATVLTAVLVAALSAPMVALASPASTIKTREAQKAVILTELDRMRIELQERIDKFTATGRDMQETQAEIDQVSARLAEVNTNLESSRTGLELRAAELYRSDRIGMLDVLLSSQNIEDLIVRTHYLIIISQRDANSLNDYRMTRSESLWLQESLNRRMDRLRDLQAEAEAERADVQDKVDKANARAMQIDADITALLRQSQAQQPTGNTSGKYDPDTLISDAKYRSQDMTASGVQDFLDSRPGRLKDYRGKDHAGVTKTAAEMIAEAAKHFNVNPKVILVTLQKEQSLLDNRHPTRNAYDWAMGCGKGDSFTTWKYKGFGNQIWGGADKLDHNAKPWHAGIKMRIDSSDVYPTNSSTYSLYKYTPHLHGTFMFWSRWLTYFHDNPAL